MTRIQNPPTLAKHGHYAAALFAVVLALAGFANAEATSSAHSHKAKDGRLTITAPTEVGGAILQPGDYEVRESNSPSGPVVEFVHHFWNELASELLQADEEEVVARVKFTEQALNSPSKHTHLMLASNTADATGLEIRGNAVGYVFDPSQMAVKADPQVVGANDGSQ
jgi:hypothetical protein